MWRVDGYSISFINGYVNYFFNKDVSFFNHGFLPFLFSMDFDLSLPVGDKLFLSNDTRKIDY